VRWGCDYATALNIEVDPQCRRFGRRESDFHLQTLIEGYTAKPGHVQVVIYRAFFYFLLHNHFINIKKNLFSGEVKDSVIFLFFFLLHKRAKPILPPLKTSSL
jgi:hypothetical protein